MTSSRLNIIYVAISQGANYLLPILAYPMLIHTIGIERFGKVSFALVIMQLSFLFIDFGFGYSATRIVALKESDFEFVKKIFMKVTIARTLLFCVSLIIILLLCLFQPFAEIKEIILITIIASLFNVINPNWLLQGLGMMRIMAINSLISRGATIFAVYIGIKSLDNLTVIMMILITPYILYSVLSVMHVQRKGYVLLYFPKLRDVVETIKDGAYFFFSTIATSAYTMLTPIILGTVSGTTALGVFNSANLVKQGVAGLIGPVIQAYYPRVNVKYQASRYTARRFVYNLLWIASVVCVAISLPFILYPSFFSGVIFGSDNHSLAGVLRLMLFLPILSVVNSMIGLLILVPEGKNKIFFKIILCGSVCCLISIYPMCHSYGAVGAVLSLIFAELVVLVGMSIYLLKNRVRG